MYQPLLQVPAATMPAAAAVGMAFMPPDDASNPEVDNGIARLPGEQVRFHYIIPSSGGFSMCNHDGASKNSLVITSHRIIRQVGGLCWFERVTDNVMDISRAYYSGAVNLTLFVFNFFISVNMLIVGLAIKGGGIATVLIATGCGSIAVSLVYLVIAFFFFGKAKFYFVLPSGESVCVEDRLARLTYRLALDAENAIRSASNPSRPFVQHIVGTSPLDPLPHEEVLFTNNDTILVTNVRVVTAIQPLIAKVECLASFVPRTFCVDRLQDVTRVRMARMELFVGASRLGLTLLSIGSMLCVLPSVLGFLGDFWPFYVLAAVNFIVGVILIFLRRNSAAVWNRALEREALTERLLFMPFAFTVREQTDMMKMEEAIRRGQARFGGSAVLCEATAGSPK
jgi:hypothetical protein